MRGLDTMTCGAVVAAIAAVTATPDDDDPAPMTAEVARLATAQVTVGALIELMAHLEGAALVLRNLGLVVDPIRLVQWQFREAIRGAEPWDPARETFGAHLKARAWTLLSKRVERIAIARAMETGHGLDELQLSPAQVGTWSGVCEAARRLAELMPFVRAHDLTYVSIAGVLRDGMRRELARIITAPTEGTVASAITGEETGPQPGCDGVTDAAPDGDGRRS